MVPPTLMMVCWWSPALYLLHCRAKCFPLQQPAVTQICWTRHSLGDAAGQVHTRPRVHEHLPGRRDKLRLQGGVVGVVLSLHPSMVIIVIVCPASVASTLLTVVIILLGLRIVVILSAACDCG